MTNSTPTEQATRLIIEIIKAQPNLLAPRVPNRTTGEELADFVDAFITRYSAYLLARPEPD